jgi:large subunit ribosomal protein L25
MATTHILKAATRTCTGSGKLNQLRKDGFIPAVVYGPGFDNANIQVDAREFALMLANAISEHFLVDLQIDGTSQKALLNEVQHDSLSGQYLHIDFLAVTETTEIHSVVPVVLVGDAAGVAQGGVLDQHIHELHIKCQVKDLPEEIEIDVKDLNLGDTIRIADVKLPAGVQTTLAADTPVAGIEAPAALTSEEEAAAATEEAPAEKAE